MGICRRRYAAILFHTLSVVIVLLTVERMVFDTLGQMWGTMIVNCMTVLCALTGMVGVSITEEMAIGVFAIWNFISIALNVIIIFIYNDVGMLKNKEHYLGLSFGNDNWWRIHGVGCETSEGSGAAGGGGGEGGGCVLSYAAIETIHGALFVGMSLITLSLSLILLCTKKKIQVPGDDESFNFVSISHYDGHTRPQRYPRKWSYSTNDTSISL